MAEKPFNLKQDQIDEIKEAFSIFDRNGDGNLRTNDLVAIMGALGQTTTEEELTELLSEFDPDNFGIINLDDFITIMTRKIKDTDKEEEIKTAFRVFDLEGTGFISAAELRHIMTNLGERLTEQEVDAMIIEADIAGDGKINYEQFAAILTLNR